MPLSPGIHDLSLSGLDPRTRQALSKLPSDWFSSIEHSLLYREPVERVRLRVNEDGTPASAVYYTETGRLFRTVHIRGPVNLTASEIQQVLRDRKAHCAVLAMMPQFVLPDGAGQWFQPGATAVLMNVIALPATADAYLESLGPSTRKHLPYYVRRLRKEWPDLDIACLAGQEIDRNSFAQVVDLSRARIETKGRVHGGFDGQAFENRLLLAQHSGLLCRLTHKGQAVAGTISYLHGEAAYLVLIGHDPQFNRLNLGNACLWLTIRHLIERGIRSYNLLWGQSFYKRQFGANPTYAYNVPICRGPLSAMAYRVLRGGQWLCAQARRAVGLLGRLLRRFR